MPELADGGKEGIFIENRNFSVMAKIEKSDLIWTVSGLTSYVKGILEENPALLDLWIKGEVTDFKRAYSGHCYFRLKDAGAVINCVMFKSRAQRVSFEVKDGLNLTARGGITLYEKGGAYQLLVQELKPLGLGELYLEFLKLKEELDKKGYFRRERKREIPLLPRCIGIATSLKGAGLSDMLKIIKNRFPGASVYVCPTTVQGAEAPDSIARSLRILNGLDEVDVIILGRGGGSFEDLNCFNHRKVAESVYKSKKPVISAVGHESDITISDLVADVRAETPTAAAQMVIPDVSDLKYGLDVMKNRLTSALMKSAQNVRIRLEHLNPRRMERIFSRYSGGCRQDLDRRFEELERIIGGRLLEIKSRLEQKKDKLDSLSYRNILKRGFCLALDSEDKRALTRAGDLTTGRNVDMIFDDGSATACITEVSTRDAR